jgi:hypothetical protein
MSVRRDVLSPLLWDMVVNSLLNQLGNYNCLLQGFANYVIILISGKFLSTVCDAKGIKLCTNLVW